MITGPGPGVIFARMSARSGNQPHPRRTDSGADCAGQSRRRSTADSRRGHQHLFAVSRKPCIAITMSSETPCREMSSSATRRCSRLRVLHDRLARREKALGIRIADAAANDDHIVAHLVGRIEAERGEIADVQLDDAMAILLQDLERCMTGRECRSRRSRAWRIPDGLGMGQPVGATSASRRSISFTRRLRAADAIFVFFDRGERTSPSRIPPNRAGRNRDAGFVDGSRVNPDTRRRVGFRNLRPHVHRCHGHGDIQQPRAVP